MIPDDPRLPAPVVRPARPEELEAVFLLGYDVWGEGAPLGDYLAECRASAKYAAGRWTVVAVEGAVAGAVLVYRGGFGLPAGAWGAGSLSVDPAVRRLGLAKALMRAVLEREPGTAFLWADVLPGFYRSLGFAPLPERCQTRPGSLLMARGPHDAAALRISYF
jgi:GNAT superfamily N-acetyltransferase